MIDMLAESPDPRNKKRNGTVEVNPYHHRFACVHKGYIHCNLYHINVNILVFIF